MLLIAFAKFLDLQHVTGELKKFLTERNILGHSVGACHATIANIRTTFAFEFG